MKFLCDQMLGSLAKWLRILGFDTLYFNKKVKDEKLIEIAEDENRVLLTRDKELIWRAKRKNLKVLEIDVKNLDDQLNCILDNIEINEDKILSRCLICNTILKDLPKKKVEGKVPERIFVKHDVFWYCPNCDKIYWKGSHYKKMIDKIKKITPPKKIK